MLVSGRWTLISGCWVLVSGRWTLISGCWALASGCGAVVRLSGERVGRPLRSPTEGAGSSFLLSCFPPTSFTMLLVNVFHTVWSEAGCFGCGAVVRLSGERVVSPLRSPTAPVPG